MKKVVAGKRIKSELEAVFGAEPNVAGTEIDDDNYNSFLGHALYWYGSYGGSTNSNSLGSLHTQWLKDWAKTNGIRSNTFIIPKEGISTMAAVARLSNLGFPFKESDTQRLKNAFDNFKALKKASTKSEKKVEKTSQKSKINVADDEKLKPFLTAYDTAIDSIMDGQSKWKIDVSGAISGVHGKELKSMYKGALRELQALRSGKDAELSESYALKGVKLRRMIKVHEEILVAIDASMKFKKALRKPRAQKVRLASDIVKKLKYSASNTEYGLVSVDPAKVVKSTTVYAFDAKKRLLKQFSSDTAIDIKGQTLQNCTVLQKKLRKPKEQLVDFLAGTRLQCDKAFKAIKAKAAETSARVNVDTLFIKSF